MLDLSPMYGELITKLLLATALSGVVGIERQFHGRAAGLRTHILVCLGATIIMACSQTVQHAFTTQGAESVFRIDPWRIAAGIVTGIGFLGGGTILKSTDLIRGLTTAACIWFVAAIGIIVGLGLYVPAVMATCVALFVLIGLHPIGHCIPSNKYGQITVKAGLDGSEDMERACRRILKAHPLRVQNTLISVDGIQEEQVLVFDVKSRRIRDKQGILNQIFALSQVRYVSWH
ncbi:MAG: MgtC/SapB family protein [Desulfobacterales bacterium]|nr:MgtC/SapB family protein [Desulfobacterales bacterium]